jgi:hypothetical protein
MVSGVATPRPSNPEFGSSEAGYGTMTNVPSDSFWRKLVKSSIEVDTVANAAGAVLGLGDKEQAFALRSRSSIQSPRCRALGSVA